MLLWRVVSALRGYRHTTAIDASTIGDKIASIPVSFQQHSFLN